MEWSYDNIGTPHHEYEAFKNKWVQLKRCLAGEEDIKAAREDYLPYPVSVADEDKSSEAFKAAYDLYLSGAHFVEFTSEAVEDLVSSAFRRPMEIERRKKEGEGNTKAELPPELTYMDLEDIAKEVVSLVGGYGRCFLLVDYPTVETTPSMKDDVKNKAYISLFPPLDVINWTETKRSGVSELTRVVLRELDQVALAEDPENSIHTPYMYRELFLEDGVFKIRLYREGKDVVTLTPKAAGKHFTEIPGVFIGTTSNTAKVDKSPVIGISNSNIKHYQTWADLMHVQVYTGHPQMVLTGLRPGWNKQADQEQLKLKLDAATLLTLEGEGSQAQLLELTSKDLMHYRTLELLERSMTEQGARIKAISNKAGVESAQALKLRSASSMSKLASIVRNAEEGLTKALKWIGEYMDVDAGEYAISINKEFFSPEPDGGLLTAISNAEAIGTAPRGTGLTYLKQIELADPKISNETYLKDMTLVTPNKAEPRQPQVNKQDNPNNIN